jgi:glycolate oxidase
VLTILDRLRDIVGPSWVRIDESARSEYGQDSLRQVHEPEAVVLPANTREVSLVAALCNETRTPLVPRGAGTGYSGGAVPVAGGIVMPLTRLDRILEIDERSLLAVVQPGVITGVLQQTVEARGLFYPPDPASLDRSAIGGNVAECAGGPRAFKYGTTRRYVLGLEAVLPDGGIVRTGSRTVKNVVGYDLTQLLVGSEGTLAIITEIILRLLPKPARRATLRAAFPSVDLAAEGAWRILKTGVMPSALELVDRACLEAVRSYLALPLAPPGTAAILLIEVDGGDASVVEDVGAIASACEAAGADEIRRAADDVEAADLWRLRRELSPALRTIAALKLNHDVVVPLGQLAGFFGFVDDLRRRHHVRIACFGHAGDGNIHVNIMVNPDDAQEVSRAHEVERLLFEGVVARQGSISGEHGIGYTKARYLDLELSGGTIGLMKRVKNTFDPNGILNPGKIFPSSER